MVPLKGGFQTEDVRLDRLQQFDARSRQYGIAAVVPQDSLYARTWRNPTWLNQGAEGACVAFAWSHRFAGWPDHQPMSEAFARELFHEAQLLDDWPDDPGQGTSVLAGAKAAKARGLIREYRWAFGIDEVLQAIIKTGPVILGVNWYESMVNPQSSGLVEVDGRIYGGHAILARGLRMKANLDGKSVSVVRLRNSWGQDWGRYGDCFIEIEDLERLLREDGECCVPIR